MANSSNVSAGDDVLASEYNNLRADILNISSGHSHDGVDSKFYYVAYGVMDIKIQSGIDSGTSGSVTFDTAFSSAPKVFISAEDCSSEMSITNISTTGFDWSAPGADGIYWIAVLT